jgi:hypothetical protein
MAGGVLRGYFKQNYMACQNQILANDVPPSFVVDSNNQNTSVTFTISDFFKVERESSVRKVQTP